MGWKNTLRIDLTWMDIAGKVMANNVRSLMSTIAPTIVPYYAGEERTGLITMPISRNLWEGTGTGKYRERI
jgi:hypothetical protein